MKRKLILTILACGASAMLSMAAQAQSPTPSDTPAATPGPWAGHGHRGHGGGPLEHLAYALGLSGSQQAAIAPIIEAAKPQLKTIHDNAMAQRKAVIESAASQITPLLTPDQQTKFAQMVQRLENGPAAAGGPAQRGFKRFRGAAAGAGGNPGGQGEVLQRLTTQLGLTVDQQNQIKPILDAAHAQVVTIRQNTSLTEQQTFAQIKDTMQAAHNQIDGLLTPAQQQQLAAMKAKWRRGQGQPSASPSPAGATGSPTP